MKHSPKNRVGLCSSRVDFWCYGLWFRMRVWGSGCHDFLCWPLSGGFAGLSICTKRNRVPDTPQLSRRVLVRGLDVVDPGGDNSGWAEVSEEFLPQESHALSVEDTQHRRDNN